MTSGRGGAEGSADERVLGRRILVLVFGGPVLRFGCYGPASLGVGFDFVLLLCWPPGRGRPAEPPSERDRG